MVVAVYPGSFDPMTKGHEDIALRAARLFDQVILAVTNNEGKAYHFNLAERLAMAQQCMAHYGLPNVTVEGFTGLTVHFARSKGAGVLIRGLRAVSDFDYECALSQVNLSLDADVQTVFLMASLEHQFLSSRMVKEVVRLGAEAHHLVSPPVHEALCRKRLASRPPAT
jgi:pantetheine-phosphate adenylyltransferase